MNCEEHTIWRDDGTESNVENFRYHFQKSELRFHHDLTSLGNNLESDKFNIVLRR